MKKLENWMIIIGVVIILIVLIFWWKDFNIQQPQIM